jgi:hypothetical protein
MVRSLLSTRMGQMQPELTYIYEEVIDQEVSDHRLCSAICFYLYVIPNRKHVVFDSH